MPKRFLIVIITLVALAILLDVYVFQGIKVLTSSPLLHRLWWIVVVGILISFLILLSLAFPKRKFTPLFNVSVNAFLTLLVTELVFIAVLLGEDVYRVAVAGFHLIQNNQAQLPLRSVWVSTFALFVAAVPFCSFIFGVTRGKYHYQVHRTTLWFDDLPVEFDGFKIAQLSDIHSGSFDKPQEVLKGVKLLNAQKPDLFVFTGDLVNNKAEEIVPYIDIFKQIEAPYGKFSVLGNHDYGDYIQWNSPAEKKANLDTLKHHQKQIGFRLLLDEHVNIEKNGQRIALLGIENWGKGFGERGDLKKALTGVNPSEFKVLLSHDPSHWDAQVKNNSVKIHLALAGHTHGMQFGIELGKFKWSPVKYRYHNWAGLVTENHRNLYVNRGFGFLGFAGRIGIWPEIAILELRKRK